ncbi:branched-chain amino acid ABC transporter substrate-binding protein [Candidatus Poriferisocius sp.]|uniref:branched-chain amino acid ABC transporter substrate-binding protein n=1 Tax=Candidatus Poriferisocius sp. TaxID=3101276 RepID=UPI003B592B65
MDRFAVLGALGMRRHAIPIVVAFLAVFALLATSCGNDDDDGGSGGRGSAMGDGSLGIVTVAEGESIQIRSLNAISGPVAFLGLPNQRAVELAIADYGDIRGFSVDMGTPLDGLCSSEGGQAAAQTIAADEQVIGVIGTSCSGAGVAAAPLITQAGMVIISPSNTSPALTSDFQGNPGESYNVGYYRTAHNDLVQGAAMANFVFSELGIDNAAALHDGDPYTQGLASAFRNSFEELGGTVSGFTGINKGDTDMVPALTELAAGSPGALFFPIFQPEGDFVAAQAPTVSGLGATLLAADGLLVDDFLALTDSVGMHFSGPDTRFGTNTNQSTGQNADQILAAYTQAYGEAPSAAFWGHSYDAAALLLDAIAAASWVEDGNLHIDRAGVRQHLNSVSGYSGITGTLSCDDFGDCASQKITVVYHLDSRDVEASKENVVYSYP